MFKNKKTGSDRAWNKSQREVFRRERDLLDCSTGALYSSSYWNAGIFTNQLQQRARGRDQQQTYDPLTC